MRRAVSLIAATFFVGCLQCEEIRTQARLADQGEAVSVALRFVNVTAEGLGCFDVEDCSEALRQLIDTRSEQRPFGSDSALATGGAKHIEVELQKRGRELDVAVSFVAPVGSAVLEMIGVHVEAVGLDGRERKNLVLRDVAGMELAWRAASRRVQAGEGTPVESPGAVVAWVGRPGRALASTILVDSSAVPLFVSVPALEPLMRTR